MKYLSSEPMVFGQYNRINTHKDDSGGPSHEIPAEDRCPSGRHNKRLTECWCEPDVVGVVRNALDGLRKKAQGFEPEAPCRISSGAVVRCNTCPLRGEG